MISVYDTAPGNGCLRLIPGSHLEAPSPARRGSRRPHERPAGDGGPSQPGLPSRGASRRRAGAGRRPCHRGLAAAALGPRQRLAQRRTVITLWYFPAFEHLPESIRSYIAAERMIDAWPSETRHRIAHLLPEYDGGARPIEWNRVPGPALRAGRRGLRR